MTEREIKRGCYQAFISSDSSPKLHAVQALMKVSGELPLTICRSLIETWIEEGNWDRDHHLTNGST